MTPRPVVIPARLRAATLPLVAVVLVCVVLGVQVLNGGGSFAPARAATTWPVSTVSANASYCSDSTAPRAASA